MEKLSAYNNAINWFEIPATDTARAKKFYETILDIKMETLVTMGMEMTFFPNDKSNSAKVSGAIIKGPMHKPSMNGAIVYMNANPTIQTVIDRVVTAGGKILMPKTLINHHIGFMAFIADTEGNRVALQAAK